MRRRRTWLIALGVIAVAGVALAAGGYWFAKSRTGNLRNGDKVPFTSTADPTVTVPTTPSSSTSKKARQMLRNGPPWPFYGRTLSRTRDASDLANIHPPYRGVWKRPGGGLLEYPPAYADGVLYEFSDAGTLTAFDVFTGKHLWRKKEHSGSEPPLGSPAIGGHYLFLTIGNSLIAVQRKNGVTAWRLNTGSALEGSPAVWHGMVFVGRLDGAMIAVSAKTGHLIWTYRTSGPVKHGPAVVDGRLYFGDYAGVMYCVTAQSGRQIWRTQTAGLAGGYRSGGFYSTPAVAYGRVYVGNTDGKVYSFDASNGQEAWSTTLPGWAYGSPAVSAGRVFETSSGGAFVALNARTGVELWRHQLPYESLSSPTVIGPLVYVSDRGPSGNAKGQSFAYNPGTGRLVWQFADGKYSTAIAAAGRLVVVGFGTLYVMKPRTG